MRAVTTDARLAGIATPIPIANAWRPIVPLPVWPFCWTRVAVAQTLLFLRRRSKSAGSIGPLD